jgi:transposase
MPRRKKQSSEAAGRDIRRKTRWRFSAEEKIRIVLDGLRGEVSVAELCRREGIAANLYYRWSKDFLEAGKKQLSGDTYRGTDGSECKYDINGDLLEDESSFNFEPDYSEGLPELFRHFWKDWLPDKIYGHPSPPYPTQVY